MAKKMAPQKPAKKNLVREDVNQAAARIVREITKQ